MSQPTYIEAREMMGRVITMEEKWLREPGWAKEPTNIKLCEIIDEHLRSLAGQSGRLAEYDAAVKEREDYVAAAPKRIAAPAPKPAAAPAPKPAPPRHPPPAVQGQDHPYKEMCDDLQQAVVGKHGQQQTGGKGQKQPSGALTDLVESVHAKAGGKGKSSKTDGKGKSGSSNRSAPYTPAASAAAKSGNNVIGARAAHGNTPVRSEMTYVAPTPVAKRPATISSTPAPSNSAGATTHTLNPHFGGTGIFAAEGFSTYPTCSSWDCVYCKLAHSCKQFSV